MLWYHLEQGFHQPEGRQDDLRKMYMYNKVQVLREEESGKWQM